MTVPNAEEIPLMSVSDAAAAMGLKKTAGVRAANEGTLPTITINGRRRVVTADLRRMLGLDVDNERPANIDRLEPTGT